MIKTQLITMHRQAPEETARILRQTMYWERLSGHYDESLKAFDSDALEREPQCIEPIAKLASSLQRTRSVETATTVAEALRGSPHYRLATILERATTSEAFIKAVKAEFSDMPGYTGNIRALLSLGELRWKTAFELQPSKTREKAEDGTGKPRKVPALKQEISELKEMIKELMIAKTGVDEETLLSFAAFIKGQARRRESAMPEFHETLYGRKFYDSQLPRLIEGVESIAKSLERIVAWIDTKEAAKKPDAEAPREG